MTITYHGNTCLKLQDKSQARDLTVVLDAYDAPSGVGSSANVVVLTNGEKNAQDFNGAFSIHRAGEFEVGGLMVYGTQQGEHTIYRMEIDDLRFVFLGRTDVVPNDEVVETFGDVDVLLVSVGKNMLTAPQAEGLIQKIQPRMVVPLASGTDLTEILRLLGKKDVEPQNKFNIVKKNLPEDDMLVLVLS